MSIASRRKLSRLALLLITSFALQGCAGIKPSYKSLIQHHGDVPAIHLSPGEQKEVLSISNGFPGWWGVSPTVVSYSPEIASVECRAQRSWIPFRSPGVIFGGEVCYLTANAQGQTWLRQGNAFAMDMTADPHELDDAIRIIVGP